MTFGVSCVQFYPEVLTQGCPNRPQLSDPLTPVVHLLTGYYCPQLLTIPNSLLWAEMTGLPKALCHRRLTAQPRRQEDSRKELTHRTPDHPVENPNPQMGLTLVKCVTSGWCQPSSAKTKQPRKLVKPCSLVLRHENHQHIFPRYFHYIRFFRLHCPPHLPAP